MGDINQEGEFASSLLCKANSDNWDVFLFIKYCHIFT